MYVCRSVAVSWKYSHKYFVLFGFSVQFCVNMILGLYCPLTLKIYEKNDERFVK